MFRYKWIIKELILNKQNLWDFLQLIYMLGRNPPPRPVNIFSQNVARRPFPEPPQINESQVLLTSLPRLGPDHLLLKDIILGEPKDLIENLKKTSTVPNQSKAQWKNGSGSFFHFATKKLIEQLKLIQDWSITQEDLWSILKDLHAFFPLNMRTIYVQFLFDKVTDGLLFMDIQEKTGEMRGRFKQANMFASRMDTGSSLEMMLQKMRANYQAFTSQNYNKESIEYIRYNSLSGDSKIKYELLVIKFLINNDSEPRRMPPRMGRMMMEEETEFRLNSQPRTYNIDKFFDLLAHTDLPFILPQLLDLRLQKSSELRRTILDLKLELIQSTQGAKVKMSSCASLNPKLVDKEIFKKLTAEESTPAFIISKNAILSHQNEIYLKYDLANISSDFSAQSIFTQSTFNQIIQLRDSTEPNPSLMVVTKQQLSNFLKAVFSLVDGVCSQKKILVYESQSTFTEIPADGKTKIVKLCFSILKSLIQESLKLRINLLFDEMIVTPEIIIYINSVLKYLQSRDIKEMQLLFETICSFLQNLLMKNEQKMAIMNNPKFIQNVIIAINRLVEGGNLQCFPANIERFLVTYVPKLFEFGLDLAQLPLEKIYELKLKTVDQRNMTGPLGGVHIHHSDLESRRNAFRANDARNTLEEFIQTFPNSADFFQNKLICNISSIEGQLNNIDIFALQALPQAQYLLKLLGSEKVNGDQQFLEKVKVLIKKHPTYFAKSLQKVNVKELGKKLKFEVEDQLAIQVYHVLELLSKSLVVDVIPASELCQEITSTNLGLIALFNGVNYLNILLNMRESNPPTNYVKELVQITLYLEQIESISLNRIVAHQGSYDQIKVQAIKEKYSQIGDKNILHFKIYSVIASFTSVCWNYFEKMSLLNVNLLLKQFKIYLELMKDTKDKNLLLKLLKKTYRNFREISRDKKININYQLYTHNKSQVVELFSSLYEQFGVPVRERDTVVIGDSLLRFVQKNLNQNINTVQQFDKIIVPHIQEALSEAVNFFFFEIGSQTTLVNNVCYKGRENVQKIIRSVFYDFKERIIRNFNTKYIALYNRILLEKSVATQNNVHSPTEQEEIIDGDLPLQPLVLIIEADKQKLLIQQNTKLLKVIFENRYAKTHQVELQQIFVVIIDKLKTKYKIIEPEKELLNCIIQQMSQNQEVEAITFKVQSQWLDVLVKSYENIKIQTFINESFVKKYVKLSLNMLNNPEENKEALLGCLIILQKLIPKNFEENDTQKIKFANSLLEVILRIVKLCSSAKSINSLVIAEIISHLVKCRKTELSGYVQQLMRIIQESSYDFGSLLCEIVEEETKFVSMEADIKSYFIRQSENLEDETADKIGTKLSNFINVFKFKYEKQLVSFSDLARKFVKNGVKKEGDKEITYIFYEKSNRFQYSQILKQEFIQFQPSDNIKHIIANLLETKDKNIPKLRNKLEALKMLIYYSPILLPYVLLHPIQCESQVPFIDYLVNLASANLVDYVNQFLLFVCLDHSCIVKIRDRTILFSEFLCFKIIKKITKIGINTKTLALTYYLNQLKRFTFLCKIKISKQERSLLEVLADHLKSIREGFDMKSGQNNIIYLIFSLIFKQDTIDNLQKCFIPKPRPSAEYSLLDSCLLPFHTYFRSISIKTQKLEKRADNIIFTGQVSTPFYPQINDSKQLEGQYESVCYCFKAYDDLSLNSVETLDSSLQDFQIEFIKNSGSIEKYSSKFKSIRGQLMSRLNSNHARMIDKLKSVYFPNSAQEELSEDLDTEMHDTEQHRIRMRMLEQQGIFGGGRGMGGRGRGRGQLMNRMNRVQPSQFAPEDYNVELRPKQQRTNIEKEFQLSLSLIPSQENLEEPRIQNFDEIKTGQEQLLQILEEINDSLMLMNEQPIKMQDIPGKDFQEKKKYLQNKSIEVDYDLHKQDLSPDQFEEYILGKEHRFENLVGNRRSELRKATERMYQINMVRSLSSDSLDDYFIDTMDINHSLIPNIKRVLSITESHSSNDRPESESGTSEPFHYENNTLDLRCFTVISEEIIYQMILQHYYISENFMCKQLMPFLENRAVQNKIISTLLCLMRNPFGNQLFPKTTFHFKERTQSWEPFAINESNSEHERLKFCERIISVFESVKNYAFYQNDAFLIEQINCEGIMGIKYDPIYKIEGKDSYIPIEEILHISFEIGSSSSTFQFLEGIKTLSESNLQKLFELMKKQQKEEEKQQQRQNERMAHHNLPPEILARRRKRPSNISFESISELMKSEEFKAKFRECYPFGVTEPNPCILPLLVQSDIYSQTELKELHIKIMSSQLIKPSYYGFLNQVIQIYTEEQLKQATWMKLYHDSIVKVISHLIATGSKIQAEPIFRLLKTGNQMSYAMKKVLFEKDLKDSKRRTDFEQQHFDSEPVYSNSEKGTFEMAFQSLRLKPDKFWLTYFPIKFINANAVEPAGGDGLKTQWFTLVTKGMVNLDNGLFSINSKNMYFFNRQSYINTRDLQYFQFIGKLFGYSLAKKYLVSPSFSTLLYKMILEEAITIDDIRKEYKDKHEVLLGIENMVQDATPQTDFFGLNFTYADKRIISTKNYKIIKNSKKMEIKLKQGEEHSIEFGTGQEEVIKQLSEEKDWPTLPEKVDVLNVKQIIELKKGGANIEVNYQNMHQYLQLYKDIVYKTIVGQVQQQFKAFMTGLKRIVNLKVIRRFTATQLRDLIEGTAEISIADMSKYTKDDTDKSTSNSEWMWSILEGLPMEERGMFLEFWTGSNKMPVEGAKVMRLNMSHHGDEHFGASTCFKSLRLPRCRTRQDLQTEVTIAVNIMRFGGGTSMQG